MNPYYRHGRRLMAGLMQGMRAAKKRQPQPRLTLSFAVEPGLDAELLAWLRRTIRLHGDGPK